MEETTTKFTQRELIEKFLGILHSVENDYNQERISDFEEELRSIEKSLCSDCGDNGTFFFTKDNLIQDSQPCGKCNKKSLDAVIQYAKLKESYLERVATANKIISEKIGEIKKLTKIKERIQNRIDSMQTHDIQCEQGLSSEGYPILGVLHDLLKDIT